MSSDFKLTAGMGCTVIKSKKVSLIHSYDNELVIYNARAMLSLSGFSETDEYIISAAASELATNILRYAETGDIEISVVRNMLDETGIEIFACDDGPGIQDIEAALTEHFSSQKNSLGMGLPSVKRIMDEFLIESIVGKGTRVLARKWSRYE